MRSSILFAATGAILAAASPVLNERKLVVATDVVMKWVTVTVTDGKPRPTMFRPGKIHVQEPTSSSISSISSASPSPEPIPSPPPAPIPEIPPPAPIPVPEVVEPVIPAPAPAPEAPAPPPVQEAPAGTDYVSTVLYHHNVHRNNHSSPDLVWSDQHAGYALESAKKCVFAHDLSPGGGGYGQNLAMFGGTNAQSFGATRSGAQAASNFWYNGELDKFPSNGYGQANPGGDFHAWGHFSQLVWASTQQVGCASVLCPAGTMLGSMDAWYTVCNYYPAGNMGGQYAKNIGPPQGHPTVAAS